MSPEPRSIGQPNPEFDYLAKGISPAKALLDLSANQQAYEKAGFADGRIVAEYYFDRTGSNPSKADLADLAAKAAARKRQYKADPDFQVAMARLAQAGIAYEFGGQGDACGEFSTLRLRGNRTSLKELEALAADDAGISDPAERAAAAERFKIFILRNYRSEWRENRKTYPDVGWSPYDVTTIWSGRDT